MHFLCASRDATHDLPGVKACCIQKAPRKKMKFFAVPILKRRGNVLETRPMHAEVLVYLRSRNILYNTIQVVENLLTFSHIEGKKV